MVLKEGTDDLLQVVQIFVFIQFSANGVVEGWGGITGLAGQLHGQVQPQGAANTSPGRPKSKLALLNILLLRLAPCNPSLRHR